MRVGSTGKCVAKRQKCCMLTVACYGRIMATRLACISDARPAIARASREAATAKLVRVSLNKYATLKYSVTSCMLQSYVIIDNYRSLKEEGIGKYIINSYYDM